MEHRYYTFWDSGKTVNHRKCKRCEAEQNAQHMEIENHEWPLPEDEVMCKAVVFELQTPGAIVFWRDATWFVVHDLGRVDTGGRRCQENILSYCPLAHYAQKKHRRITLASSAKSMRQTHYFKDRLNIGVLFVQNGLVPRLKDIYRDLVWTEEQQSRTSLRQYCQSQLPGCPPKHMVQQVNTTNNTHNYVLAMHSNCPPEMTPHEHVLFGSLRAGERLQFINVLAMVMSSAANLNSKATSTLVLQAISQVGRRESSQLSPFMRSSQLDLLNNTFCESLKTAIEARFSSIETNWKQTTAAGVLLNISIKVLSLCPHIDIQRQYLCLIRRIRQAALGWTRRLAQLYGKERSAPTGSQKLQDISRQIVNSSLLVRRTYDLDTDRQQLELTHSGAVADYVEASVYLHDHKASAALEHCFKQQNELLSDSYCARHYELHLVHLLQHDCTPISDGIKRFWPTASFTGSWQLVDANDTSWINTFTNNSIVVHYNLVTGSLLVGGRPISRLPADYTEDPLYQSIFPEYNFDVAASDEDDMEFMSRVAIEGHRIYFGKREGKVLIRSHDGSDKYEAILRDVFTGDLPDPIFKNNRPWMSLRDGKIVFRRPERAWSSHGDDWTLFLDVNSRTKIFMKSNIGHLVDSRSDVGQVICNMFQPFENPEHIMIIIPNDETTGMQIKLPRYHLNFSVQNNGDVKCQELSAVVDRNQSIGTLYGLQNLLVLRAAKNQSAGKERIVLIPNGNVTYSPVPHHVNVHIQLGNDESLLFSKYRLDGRLGRLISDDLEGHLFKTFLHAVTSFPERDKLTSRTGTEEALLSLSDHLTLTSIPFSSRARKLLESLAALSPVRQFYPVNLQTMHRDTFQKFLPVLAQRDIFFGVVENIISHNSKASFLFEKSISLPRYRGAQILLHRSHRHTSKLFAKEPIAEAGSASKDIRYDSRDFDVSLAQRNAFLMVTLVTTGADSFRVDPDVRSLVQSWETISGFKQEFSILSFSQILSKPLNEYWASLLQFCRSRPSKYSLVFILSLLNYAEPSIGLQLRTLLAFYVSLSLQNLPSPEHDFYDLGQGHQVNEDAVLSIISHCEKKSARSRVVSDRETVDQSAQILEAVLSSWRSGPGSGLTLPQKSELSHFNYEELEKLLVGQLSAWRRNHVFLSLCDAYEEQLEKFKDSWIPSDIPITQLTPHQTEHHHSLCPVQLSLLNIMKSVAVTSTDFNESFPSMLDCDLTAFLPSSKQVPLMETHDPPTTWEELEDIVEELGGDSDPIVKEYGRFIARSLNACRVAAGSDKTLALPSLDFLREKATTVQSRVNYMLNRTRELLSPQLPSDRGLLTAHLWPSVSDVTLLRLLAAEHRDQLPPCWKKIIIQFGEEITALQRIERMQKYLAANDNFALSKELMNPGHAAWSTELRPDWLLLEIQNQILIRPIQIQIAMKMMEPESGVVLADMGIGKSSTILPMVVTALATGSSLVRVVVLKPLANEMLRILSRALSGLVGRTVWYLPVSRQTDLTRDNPKRLKGIYEACRQTGGVLVSLPEHLNSFRLLCNDKLYGDPILAQQLFGIQKWLDRTARDIMDESDQLLEPAYELVYTTGESIPLSGSPRRWLVSLEILDLVQRNASQAIEAAPLGLELGVGSPDAFNHIRVLNDWGSEVLMSLLVDAVLQGELPSVHVGGCTRKSCKRFAPSFGMATLSQIVDNWWKSISKEPINWMPYTSSAASFPSRY